jgi:hypothetical protein
MALIERRVLGCGQIFSIEYVLDPKRQPVNGTGRRPLVDFARLSQRPRRVNVQPGLYDGIAGGYPIEAGPDQVLASQIAITDLPRGMRASQETRVAHERVELQD